MSFSFGQPASSSNTPSFGTSGLFGQQKQNAPTPSFGSGSLFGGSNTGSSPSNTNPAGGLGNSSLFGQPQQSTGGIGNPSTFGTQPLNGLSATTTAAPPSSTTPVNAGASSAQPLFSWSTNPSAAKSSDMGMSSANPNGFLLSSTMSPNAAVSNAQYGPAQPPSIEEQTQKVLNAWNLKHPDNAFQRYFYNKVPVEQAALYVKPATHNQQKWDEAVANRPSNSVVPVLAVGFPDVQKRMNMQINQVNAYRIRMREIVETLERLGNKHDLSSNIKLAEAKNRHIQLSERVLRLAIKVHVLRHRGYALKSNEEDLRKRLDDLAKSLNNPEVFGRLNEIWARITLIFEGKKVSDEQRNSLAKGAIDWSKNNDQLQTITDVLRDHQNGLSYVAKLIQEDLGTLSKQLDDQTNSSK
ncbi:nucleoporin Nup44 [Schizosaccharomyces octosporus yFS286]|uniref:Nucleoporin Nup44 n=1 Tax=Schizosaccharomyces octosporus (strain yFS286) TaxID=483514 RepID=S9PTV4_SCHOY|nr:nucleoporin Nup44 [Schizosaccharomyces octosporus yFS286]EPX72556.1 nucleoporin Nup44 [Schizosaccharomyces octosporus yFS286]